MHTLTICNLQASANAGVTTYLKSSVVDSSSGGGGGMTMRNLACMRASSPLLWVLDKIPDRFLWPNFGFGKYSSFLCGAAAASVGQRPRLCLSMAQGLDTQTLRAPRRW